MYLDDVKDDFFQSPEIIRLSQTPPSTERHRTQSGTSQRQYALINEVSTMPTEKQMNHSTSSSSSSSYSSSFSSPYFMPPILSSIKSSTSSGVTPGSSSIDHMPNISEYFNDEPYSSTLTQPFSQYASAPLHATAAHRANQIHSYPAYVSSAISSLSSSSSSSSSLLPRSHPSFSAASYTSHSASSPTNKSYRLSPSSSSASTRPADIIDLSDEFESTSTKKIVENKADVIGITHHSHHQLASLIDHHHQQPHQQQIKPSSKNSSTQREMKVRESVQEKGESKVESKSRKDMKEKEQKKKRHLLKINMQLVGHGVMAISCRPPDPRVIDMVKNVNDSVYDEKIKLWCCPVSSHSALVSRFTSLNTEVTEVVIERIDNKYLQDGDDHQRDAQTAKFESMQHIPRKLAKWLYPFQREGVEFAVNHKGRVLIGDEMGLGKSIQAISIASYYRSQWPVLVVCPSSLRLNWRNEIERWLPQVTGREITVVFSGKDRLLHRGNHFQTLFVIISYDLLVRFERAVQKANFQVIIADESHYIKSDKAKRSQVLAPLLIKAPHCILLTGTPALSRPMELYRQISCVAPGVFGTMHQFGMRYCNGRKGRFGWEYKGAENLPELHFLLKKHVMIRRMKDDVLTELRPKTRTAVMVTIDDPSVEQACKKLINLSSWTGSMVNSHSPESSSSSASALSGMSNEARQQLFELYQKTGKAKLSAVLQYIGDLLEGGCKFLVFAHHLAVLDGIEEYLQKNRYSYFRLDGSTKAIDRQTGVEKFQNDSTVRVALLSITAGGTGITLTASSTVVFAELTWNPAALVQAEDRVHRIGQPNAVNIHYLIARHSLDDLLWPMLVKKMNVVASALDGSEDELVFAQVKGNTTGLQLKQDNSSKQMELWLNKERERREKQEEEKREREVKRKERWKDAIEIKDEDYNDENEYHDSQSFSASPSLPARSCPYDDEDELYDGLIYISDDDEEVADEDDVRLLAADGKDWNQYDKDDGFIVDDDDVEYEDDYQPEQEDEEVEEFINEDIEDNDLYQDSNEAEVQEQKSDDNESDSQQIRVKVSNEGDEDDGEAEYEPEVWRSTSSSKTSRKRILAADDDDDDDDDEVPLKQLHHRQAVSTKSPATQANRRSSTPLSSTSSSSSSSASSNLAKQSRSSRYASLFEVDPEVILEEDEKILSLAKKSSTDQKPQLRKYQSKRLHDPFSDASDADDDNDFNVIEETNSASHSTHSSSTNLLNLKDLKDVLLSMEYPKEIIDHVTSEMKGEGQQRTMMFDLNVALDRCEEEKQQQEEVKEEEDDISAVQYRQPLKSSTSSTSSSTPSSTTAAAATIHSTIIPSHLSKRVISPLADLSDTEDLDDVTPIQRSSHPGKRRKLLIEINEDEERAIINSNPADEGQDDVSGIEWVDE